MNKFIVKRAPAGQNGWNIHVRQADGKPGLIVEGGFFSRDAADYARECMEGDEGPNDEYAGEGDAGRGAVQTTGERINYSSTQPTHSHKETV